MNSKTKNTFDDLITKANIIGDKIKNKMPLVIEGNNILFAKKEFATKNDIN